MKSRRLFRYVLPLLAVAMTPWFVAHARTIDLSTVPPRAGVQLTIYNSEDLTLVRERRSLTLKKGLNQVQFSWANTRIDPTSVEIRPLQNEDDIEVLDTTYLGDKPQHCIWNIRSDVEGQVPFEVTYFTSGISWQADYVVVANPDETRMSFDGFVRIINESGEDYEDAQVRLVVGVVNLVEKIAELAARGIPVPLPGQPVPAALRQQVMYEAVGKADQKRLDDATRPAEILKEGLSEYFIYTIEGTQMVPHGWSKRLASFSARGVEFDILYRLRPHQYGPRPIRFFLLKNDDAHKMGTTPLPDGIVRTFRENGKGGLSYLGETPVNYVPIKADIELNVGLDDEVVQYLTCMEVARSNFHIINGGIAGYDETRKQKEEIRNFKDKAIRMEIRHVIPGDVDVSAEGATLHDYHTLQFVWEVKPHTKFRWNWVSIHHFGTNGPQDRIRLNRKES